jgi:acetyltransferase
LNSTPDKEVTGMNRHSELDYIFAPRSIAVIGATSRERSVGRTIVENLLKGACREELYAVNPKYDEVLGVRCYKDIGSVPRKVDLAIVVTPAPAVPAVIGECAKAGVLGAIVISAGFKEKGEEGALLEQEIRRQLVSSKMRLIGPNCLGVMNPVAGINATFAHGMALPGTTAFLSQSGALETAILDWSLREQVGFGAIVSTGSMLDVGWGDLIDYFGQDDNIRSIILYMESVGDARSFLSAARETALRKPIIVIKAGRSEAASHAATSHTGALTGSDEVFDAAVRRCGVLRVQSISDLFHMAETLDRQPRPRGNRLAILTNAGGPGVLAADELIANGGELARLADSSLQVLSQFLSPNWSHGNPIDVLGDAASEDYARALDIAMHDPNCDGVLAILSPQDMTDPSRVAKLIEPYARGSRKPILASWMGGGLMADGVTTLNKAGIATFDYPDAAARAFCYMWRYSYNLRGIYETPSLGDEVQERDDVRQTVERVFEKVRNDGRTLLTEVESKEVLAHYGIPVVNTQVARSEDEATVLANAIGFPVVLKVYSETITHKTDIGGVKLNLSDAQSVRAAYRDIESAVREKVGADRFQGVTVQKMVPAEGYELILGSSVDPQFGPVILFGSGGQLVEVYRDRALGLPPLNATLAHRLMEQTRIFTALKGVRGRAPVDVSALEQILVRFSKLVVEQPWLKEIDINPLLASPKGIIALDARIVMHPADTDVDHLPKPAIRPYPDQYVGRWKTKTGTPVLIRPIRPEDEPSMVKFHESLSRSSVYLRYFHMLSLDTRVDHVRLMQQCFVDYDREIALVAVLQNATPDERKIVGVARLIKTYGRPEGEVTVVVTDAYQEVGLGSELVRRLIDVARNEKLERIVIETLPENEAMRAIAERLNFQTEQSYKRGALTLVLDLVASSSTTPSGSNVKPAVANPA